MPVADLTIKEKVPLAPLTTIGVGGPARYFVRAERREQVQAAAIWAAERDLPLLVLGRGSNLIVADTGFHGLVLQVVIPGINIQQADGMVEITAGAGENWSALVAEAVAHDWAGMECLAGVPGLVGASPVQNIGAYGQEVRSTITAVEAFDLQAQQEVTFTNADCLFGYRDSRFKREDRGRYVILSVSYRLVDHGQPTVHYVELERALAAAEITRPTIQDVWRTVLEIRQRKSMLLNPDDPNARSVGSFFVNPLLTEEQMTALDAVIATTLAPGEHIPRFSALGGGFKVPAAWLIERSGFSRGHEAGSVGLSSRHSLAIINRGGATAQDILALARTIRARVYDRFGVTLLPEPILVGVGMEDV